MKARSVIGGGASVLVVLGIIDTGAQSSSVIRDPTGKVACVVSAPAARTATVAPDSDRVIVELRAPETPPSTITARLPDDKRDFSSVPIDVHLVPSLAAGASEVKSLRLIQPLSVEPALVRPTIDGRRTTDSFIRVIYPRDVLQPGVDIVAERTVVAANGEKVTSQTRCRITEADAAKWR